MFAGHQRRNLAGPFTRVQVRGRARAGTGSGVRAAADVARQTPGAGGNDLGGTLVDENSSRAAGASHGQRMDETEFAAMLPPDRNLEQRTTLYGRVVPA